MTIAHLTGSSPWRGAPKKPSFDWQSWIIVGMGLFAIWLLFSFSYLR